METIIHPFTQAVDMINQGKTGVGVFLIGFYIVSAVCLVSMAWLFLTMIVDLCTGIIDIIISPFTSYTIPKFNEYNADASVSHYTPYRGKMTEAVETYTIQVRMDNGWSTVGNVVGDGPNSQFTMQNVQNQFGGRQVRLARSNGQIVDIM